jgi:hypothetical protein
MNILALSLFQQIAVPFLVLLFLGTVVAVAKGWATRREGTISTIVWLAAAAAILRPLAVSRLAQGVGIDRGADLVSYCAVLAMMIGFWMVYIRLRRLRREVTLLVRHVALLEAQQSQSEESQKEESPSDSDRSDATESPPT